MRFEEIINNSDINVYRNSIDEECIMLEILYEIDKSLNLDEIDFSSGLQPINVSNVNISNAIKVGQIDTNDV
jgi:hypothetical protein